MKPRLSGLTSVRITRSGHPGWLIPAAPFLACVLLGTAASGCHLKDSSSTSDGTTETFTGTLNPQGTALDTITVSQQGTVSVTLTSLSPQSTVAVRLGIGTSGGSTTSPTCSLTSSVSPAVVATSPQISVTESAGTYCVEIADTGGLTAATTFSMTIAHP
ncbi:MAG TPA: hypothetical protein VNZ26_21510 [Vicinamibacterales bacterium]|nr:hypothetical protein [Vicinamibacterales bacterium]